MPTSDEHAWTWLARDPAQRQAQVRPDALAVHVLATGQRLTFAGLDAEVARCQAFLETALSGRGARVALLARNSLHHLTLFYGCPRAGAVFQPLNWRLSGAELGALLADAEPELVIYEAEFEAAAREALARLPGGRALRIAADDDAFAAALSEHAPARPAQIDPLAPSLLLYTSGTTGRPKGVIHTPRTCFFASTNFTFVGELTGCHAQLCDVPLFHVVGLLAILNASVLAGAATHLADRFLPEPTLIRLADPALGVTHYFCVPQMAQALIENAAFPGADLAGLRLFTGGAPMAAQLTLALIDKGVRPSNGYGMSENGTVLGVPLDPAIARTKAGSAGVPAPAIEIRLVGPDGRDVDEGEAGEIWLRGPSITEGYWRQPQASAEAFRDGWFRTGDAARRDADGHYFIVDRWKDMFITGGENVYPAEVEQVLGEHAAVADVAVIGVPDPRWGESGCAYVVVRPGEACDARAALAWCDGRLAHYKRPTHVRFVDALPRTASGKVQKDVLRARFAAEADA